MGMLALDLRRQHHRIYPSDQHLSPAIQQPHLSYFDHLPYTSSTPSPSTFNTNNHNHNLDRNLGYFNAQSTIDSSSSQSINPSQYMTDYYGSENPAIRIQQSSPAPGMQLPQSFTDSASQLTNNWNNGQAMAVRPMSQAAAFNRNRSHQRAQSSSSMGSNASGSPYSQSHAAYGYNVNDTSVPTKIGQNYGIHDQSSSQFSNHLPTPTQTPTQDSFLSTSYPNSYSHGGEMNSVMAASMAMNNNIDTHSNADDELPGMSHSGRQSVSSMGQDPSTPRTIPESYDDGFRVPQNDQQMRFPKLDRTVSDAYNDALFTGSTQVPASAAPKSIPAQHLSPHRNTINEYLQRAQMARSQSPTSQGSRGVSPFRPSSPYIQTAFGQMQRPFTATQMRQAQQVDASQREMSQHISRPQSEAPKTISPKDAVLEYNESEEDAKMPLFNENEASAYSQQFGGGQQNYSTGVQNIGSLNPSRNNTWSNDAQQRQNGTTNSAAFNFATPSISSYAQNLPFSSQNYRPQGSSLKQEETPEFPAHLTSMESSASEAPLSSQNSNHSSVQTTKPVSSAADSGTYTCTYNGCNLRFESPQKLQKHKRDSHRTPAAGTQATPGIGSGMTSAELAARNSQTGPHKCERINPTTGKPCNTIFSRPYDLTRHEDTIHNVRKQKVRCALCVEDKTFSRNDALTRHMRVVHPEVDFPGKHRRRGHD